MKLSFPRQAAFCLFTLTLGLHSTFAAQTWHVSGTGDDSRDGTTAEAAFRTLRKAAENVQPGDTVLVGNGVYTDEGKGSGSAILKLDQHGSPDAWTTWKAAPGAHPELRPTGWNGISVSGSYVIIDGLNVTGANDSISLIEALTDVAPKDGKVPQPNPRFNTNGISVEGRQSPPDRKPHHVIIRNCTVAKCPGGGITMLEADHFTVEDCVVYGNAWYMRYAGSGITTNGSWQHDDDPGYHVVIQRNLVWDNKTLVPWTATGKLSDGNGILLDVTDQMTSGATNPNADAAVSAAKPTPATPPASETPTPTPTPAAKPRRPEWTARALIANNVSAYNGGSGIHVFRTAHVDIINNTTYWNGVSVNYQELFPNRSDDVVILNNVIIPRPGGKVTSDNRNTNIHWDYNLYPVDQNIFKGAHDVVAEPGFISVRRDLREADFRLAPGSPALDSGTDEVPQATDLTKAPRPAGAGRDRGAYEQ